MPRQNPTDQIEALRQKQMEIAKQIKEAEAKAREKEKADEARRAQLAGAIALSYAAAHPESPFAATLRALLAEALKKPTDRALFPALLSEALPAIDSPPTAPPPTTEQPNNASSPVLAAPEYTTPPQAS
jgi:hypothetical protein